MASNSSDAESILQLRIQERHSENSFCTARGPATAALRALCIIAVPGLAATHPEALAPLLGACEQAAAIMGSGGELKTEERIALAEAMAAVAGALPPPHSEDAVRRLAGPATMSCRQLADAKVGSQILVAGNSRSKAVSPLPSG